MISETVDNRRLATFLSSIDADLAARARAKGCAHCGGTLHSAAYAGKPCGLPDSIELADRRHSFCCQTCRRRTTPASVRFLGRCFRRYRRCPDVCYGRRCDKQANRATARRAGCASSYPAAMAALVAYRLCRNPILVHGTGYPDAAATLYRLTCGPAGTFRWT
jgi:hypothetical protein